MELELETTEQFYCKKLIEVSNNLFCTICQDSLGSYGPPVTTTCGHSFCEECIDSVESTRTFMFGCNIKSCPTCKTLIDYRKIQINYTLTLISSLFISDERKEEMLIEEEEFLKLQEERKRIEEVEEAERKRVKEAKEAELRRIRTLKQELKSIYFAELTSNLTILKTIIEERESVERRLIRKEIEERQSKCVQEIYMKELIMNLIKEDKLAKERKALKDKLAKERRALKKEWKFKKRNNSRY